MCFIIFIYYNEPELSLSLFESHHGSRKYYSIQHNDKSITHSRKVALCIPHKPASCRYYSDTVKLKRGRSIRYGALRSVYTDTSVLIDNKDATEWKIHHYMICEAVPRTTYQIRLATTDWELFTYTRCDCIPVFY